MKATLPIPGDIAARGDKIYQEKIRQILEPAHNGEIVVINIETGEYELNADHITAIKGARARWPEGLFFSARVGFDTIAHIGASLRKKAE